MRRHGTESRRALSEGRREPGAACSATSPRSPLCPGWPRGGAKGFVSTPLDQTTSMVLPSSTVRESHILRILRAREGRSRPRGHRRSRSEMQAVSGGTGRLCEGRKGWQKGVQAQEPPGEASRRKQHTGQSQRTRSADRTWILSPPRTVSPGHRAVLSAAALPWNSW